MNKLIEGVLDNFVGVAVVVVGLVILGVAIATGGPPTNDGYYWGYFYKVRDHNNIVYYTNHLKMQGGFLYFTDQDGKFRLVPGPEVETNPGYKARSRR